MPDPMLRSQRKDRMKEALGLQENKSPDHHNLQQMQMQQQHTYHPHHQKLLSSSSLNLHQQAGGEVFFDASAAANSDAHHHHHDNDEGSLGLASKLGESFVDGAEVRQLRQQRVAAALENIQLERVRQWCCWPSEWEWQS